MSSKNSSLTCWPPSLPLVNSGLRCVKPWGWPSTEVHQIHGHTILQYINTRPNQLATTARCERNNKRNCSVWTTSGSPCAKNPPRIKSDSTVFMMTQNSLLYRGGNRQANARLQLRGITNQQETPPIYWNLSRRTNIVHRVCIDSL